MVQNVRFGLLLDGSYRIDKDWPICYSRNLKYPLNLLFKQIIYRYKCFIYKTILPEQRQGELHQY